MIDAIKLAGAVEAGVVCEQLTGLPREVTVAQWALESGWGDHEPQGNCFGIKEYPACCGVQELMTTEVVYPYLLNTKGPDEKTYSFPTVEDRGAFIEYAFSQSALSDIPRIDYEQIAQRYGGTGNRVEKHVYQWFATFPSIKECFTKHAELITDSPRYANCWNGYLDNHDLHQFILALAAIYAGDEHYSEKLFGILNMGEVKDALGTSFNIHTPPTPTAA